MGLGVIENTARSDQWNSDSTRSDQIISTSGGTTNTLLITMLLVVKINGFNNNWWALPLCEENTGQALINIEVVPNNTQNHLFAQRCAKKWASV